MRVAILKEHQTGNRMAIRLADILYAVENQNGVTIVTRSAEGKSLSISVAMSLEDAAALIGGDAGASEWRT